MSLLLDALKKAAEQKAQQAEKSDTDLPLNANSLHRPAVPEQPESGDPHTELNRADAGLDIQSTAQDHPDPEADTVTQLSDNDISAFLGHSASHLSRSESGEDVPLNDRHDLDQQHQTSAVEPHAQTGTEDLAASANVSLEYSKSQDETLSYIESADNDPSLIQAHVADTASSPDNTMAPEDAKRLFLKQSLKNRSLYYKAYALTTVIILLMISAYTLFGLQAESEKIDAAVAPLLREPVPDVPQTIEDTPQNDDVAAADLPEKIENVAFGAVEKAPAKPVPVRQQRTEEAASPPPKVVSQPPAERAQITSSSQLVDQDRWLVEAYHAYQHGDDETALERYNRVLEFAPLNRNALLARAAIAVQNGDSTTAIKNYQALLAVNPKDSVALSLLITTAHMSPRESELRLQSMLRRDPESPHLNFVLANVYGSQNRWKEAQSLYWTAFKNNPQDPNYAYNLAVSLEHIGKPKLAIPYYEKALTQIRNALAIFDERVVLQRLETLRQ